MRPGMRPTFLPSGILIYLAVWSQHDVARAKAYHRTKWHLDPSSCLAAVSMGRKLGAVPRFGEKAAGSPSSTMWPGPRPTSIPSGILIHAAVWPQQTWAEIGALPPFCERELCPHLAQCGFGRGLPSYQVATSSIEPFGHNICGLKIGGCAPLGTATWVPI